MTKNEIRNYSDSHLLLSLENLFMSERRTTRFILVHLREIDARLLFAKRGYSTLKEMLIKLFKLSETSANRRIKAMQILKDVPQAEESFLKGEVNLSTLAMAQQQIQQQERITGNKVGAEQKVQIVNEIKNKTQAEVEVALFKLLPETETMPQAHQRRISVDTTRMGLNFPDRLMNKIKRLQDIWSHSNPNRDYVETLEKAVDIALQKVDPLEKAAKAKAKTSNSKIKIESEQDLSETAEHGATHCRPVYFLVS